MGKKIRNIIRILCIVVLVGSIGTLAFIGYSYYKSSTSYEELRQYKILPSVDNASSKANDALAAMSVDWDALLAKNPDTVAWVMVEGTNIDYPVVQAADNEHYLYQGFDGTWSASGSIFLDADDPADFSSRNSMLYGHHMRDGSMFASLASLADQEAFDQCGKAYLLTPSKSMLLKPIALLDVASDDEQIQLRPNSTEDEEAYVDAVLARAICKAGDVDSAQVVQTVALVTCDELGSDGRYVLVCSVERSVSLK